jgi:hypothetical protein
MIAKEEHRIIATAMFDFMEAGYILNSISYKNGALEVVCYPPEEKSSGEISLKKRAFTALLEGHGVEEVHH